MKNDKNKILAHPGVHVLTVKKNHIALDESLEVRDEKIDFKYIPRHKTGGSRNHRRGIMMFVLLTVNLLIILGILMGYKSVFPRSKATGEISGYKLVFAAYTNEKGIQCLLEIIAVKEVPYEVETAFVRFDADGEESVRNEILPQKRGEKLYVPGVLSSGRTGGTVRATVTIGSQTVTIETRAIKE